MDAEEPIGLDDILGAVRGLTGSERRVHLVVLFGAPGRGKTTLATYLGRAQHMFMEVNGSCERRGAELREALGRFISDGNQAAVREQRSGLPPTCALLLDEADGLGAVGQATVASFVDELEDGGRGGQGSARPLRMGDWRALILLTCNMLSRLHDSVLSRAHVLAEVPRPGPEALVQAARRWFPGQEQLEPRLEEIAAMADGDYRAMRQLATLELCGGSGALGSGMTPATKALLRVLKGEGGDGGAAMGVWQDAWKDGLRADDVQHWVTLALYLPSLSPERKLALLRFRRSLEAMQQQGRGPHTLLQVVGAYARDVYFGAAAEEEEGRAAHTWRAGPPGAPAKRSCL